MRPSQAAVLVAVVGMTLGGGGALLRLPGSYLWLLAGLLLVAAWIGDRDPWLGLLAGYVVLRSGLALVPLSLEAGLGILFGCVALVLAREVPVGWWRPVWTTVAGITLGFLAIQGLGYDPLWLWDRPMPPGSLLHGLTGNPGYVGALLAMAAGVAAGWALPLIGLGIVASKSVLAGIAFAVALVWRFPRSWRWAAVSSSVVLAGVWWFRGFDLTSWVYRWETWKIAGRAWIGSWDRLAVGLAPAWPWRTEITIGSGWQPERFVSLHNDLLEFATSFGLVGVAILAGWLWAHRDAWRSEAAPGLAALVVVSLGAFPFQVAPVAPLCIVILGMATARRPPAHPRDREAPG